jgi:hypothetical protein
LNFQLRKQQENFCYNFGVSTVAFSIGNLAKPQTTGNPEAQPAVFSIGAEGGFSAGGILKQRRAVLYALIFRSQPVCSDQVTRVF